MYFGSTVANNGYDIANLISNHFGSTYKTDNYNSLFDFFEQEADIVLPSSIETTFILVYLRFNTYVKYFLEKVHLIKRKLFTSYWQCIFY